LFLSPPLDFFPSSIESHEVFDPIVFEQTQALQFFFPLLLMGFKFQGINLMFNTFSLVQYYTLQMFQL
jgi:hypothetical protein